MALGEGGGVEKARAKRGAGPLGSPRADFRSCLEKFCNHIVRMDTNTTKRPKKLTEPERKAWDHIVREMKSRGIDCDSRVTLIKDYVKLEARIERLSDREKDPEWGSVQASRALNVAIAERRRLHTALFTGARKPKQLPTLVQTEEREAYTAWTDFYEGWDDWKDRSQKDRAEREAELTRLYGEPSMRVLILPRLPTPSRQSAQEFYDWMDAA